MKKILTLLILCMIFLVGCNNEKENNSIETYVISGTIEEKSHRYYTTYLVIENDDGIKYPVYEMHSGFSDGLHKGDKVCFEIEKSGNGYKIIGFGLENNK